MGVKVLWLSYTFTDGNKIRVGQTLCGFIVAIVKRRGNIIDSGIRVCILKARTAPHQ